MKTLVGALLVLLSLSVFLNIRLLTAVQDESPLTTLQRTELFDVLVPENDTESSSLDAYPRTSDDNVQTHALLKQRTSIDILPKEKQIRAIRQMLAAQEYLAARDRIRELLKESPSDIELLLLEAKWVSLTADVSDTLSHYYGLLDLPLNTEQKAAVLLVINTLTSDNIDTLKSIRAWDLLTSFLEPLWQFDPTKKSIIVGLAESYAHQRQEFLMENALASLPQGDANIAKIRQILLRQISPEQITDTATVNIEDYERVIDLRQRDNHFIARAQFTSHSVSLMLDTGASTTVLTTETFERIRYRNAEKYLGTYTINTAGSAVKAPVYQFAHFRLAGFSLKDIAVVVMPMDNFNAADGLLGMNVMRNFDFKIDQQRSKLLLTPIYTQSRDQ